VTAGLSRLNALGIAPEATPGLYVAPVNAIAPDSGWSSTPDIMPLRDESLRGNDSVLQGVYPGVRTGKLSFSMDAYPIETGHCLRGMIGPDTVTAAPSSTTLTGSTANAGTNTAAGTVALVPGAVFIVNAGGTTAEIRYAVDATHVNQNWIYTHAAGETVTYLTKHVFNQANTAMKTYSLSDLDNVQSGCLGYTYGRQTSLSIAIDTAARVKVSSEWTTFFPTAQSTFTPGYSSPFTLPPMVGWQWVGYNAATLAPAGIASRYQTATYQWQRAADIIPGSDGTQDPREIGPGDLTVSAKAKAVYDVTTDFTNFRDKVQATPFNTFIGSASGSGAALLITMSRPSWDTFTPDRSGKYATAEVDINGIHNSTDVGSASVTLWNTQTTAF
jgi:hypothetical protein